MNFNAFRDGGVGKMGGRCLCLCRENFLNLLELALCKRTLFSFGASHPLVYLLYID